MTVSTAFLDSLTEGDLVAATVQSSTKLHLVRIRRRVTKEMLRGRDANPRYYWRPQLTGRDVKNLLKLASFISEADGAPITYDTLELTLRFKPTLAAE